MSSPLLVTVSSIDDAEEGELSSRLLTRSGGSSLVSFDAADSTNDVASSSADYRRLQAPLLSSSSNGERTEPSLREQQVIMISPASTISSVSSPPMMIPPEVLRHDDEYDDDDARSLAAIAHQSSSSSNNNNGAGATVGGFRNTPPSAGAWITAYLGLVKNMVGSGLLTIPWTLAKSGGPVPGVMLLTAVAALSWIGFAFIGIVCSRIPSAKSLADLCTSASIKKNPVLFILTLYTYGSCLSYALLACDFVASEGGLARGGACGGDEANFACKAVQNRWFVAFLFFALIAFPSSRVRDLSALRIASTVSLIGLVAMLVIAGSEPGSTAEPDEPVAHRTNPLVGVWLAHPIYIVCFSAHYNAPRFYSESGVESPQAFAKLAGLAVLTSLVVYVVFGVVSWDSLVTKGNVHEGARLKSDVIRNYGEDSSWARVSMLIVVTTSFPFAFYALQASVHSLANSTAFAALCGCLSSRTSVKRSGTPSKLLGATLALACCLPAALVDDVGHVLDYKGAVLGGFVVFFLPSILLLRVSALGAVSKDDVGVAGAKFLVGWAVFASVAGFVATTARVAGKIS